MPEAASAAVGKSVEGGTLVCVIVGTAHALVGVVDDVDVAGINTGDVAKVASDGCFLLDLSCVVVSAVSCFFSDASDSVCGCVVVCCCCERQGELEVEPQLCNEAGEDAGTSVVPTAACSLLKLGKLMGRGADILLESNL